MGMRMHSVYVFTCVCGKHHEMEDAEAFTCSCGRRSEIAWGAEAESLPRAQIPAFQKRHPNESANL